MSKAKIFEIKGGYIKLHQPYEFTKYVKALTSEDALERVYCEVGSNRVLRRKITISSVQEVPLEECDDLFIHQINELAGE